MRTRTRDLSYSDLDYFLPLLMLEEPYLPLDPATISYKLATFSDHSMTWYDDDDRIVVIGSSDCSDCFRVTNLGRLFLITPSVSIWNSLESFP